MNEAAESSKRRLFWIVAAAIVVADLVTKALAVSSLTMGFPRDVVGTVVRLNLVYNPGAAFGINFGPSSRWIFLALTARGSGDPVRLYRATRAGDVARTLAVALVAAERSGTSSTGFDRPWASSISSTSASASIAGPRSTSRTWP